MSVELAEQPQLAGPAGLPGPCDDGGDEALLAAGWAGIEAWTLPVEAPLSRAARTSPFPPFHLGSVDYLQPREPDASALLETFRGHADTTSPGDHHERS